MKPIWHIRFGIPASETGRYDGGIGIYGKKGRTAMGKAKPFVKWVGGKTQLLSELDKRLPADFADFDTYIEPFVGGGAFLFHVVRNFPRIRHIVINDINSKLIGAYRAVQENPDALIEELHRIEDEFLPLGYDARKDYYLRIRERFNAAGVHDRVMDSAWFIFLNRTGFNGLYRENSRGAFNVPFGRYANPTICDEKNIRAVSLSLKGVTILCGDFSETLKYAEGETLFYFDPPYKPLSMTSSFNSYSKEAFGDSEQIRLGEFCREINRRGHQFLLSNSDVKGKNPPDTFFDDLYDAFTVNRVFAIRCVNSNPKKRGRLTELLVTN